MNNFKYFIFTILIVSLFSSCMQTYYTGIEIRKTAPITLNPDTKKIIITDNSYISNVVDSTYLFNSQTSLTKMVIDSMRIDLLNSMARYMNQEGIYDSVEVYKYYPKPLYLYKEAADQIETPLTKEEIVNICIRTGSDVLISLDFLGVSAQFTPHSSPDFAYVKSKTGAKIRAYSSNGNVLSVPILQIDSVTYIINIDDEAKAQHELTSLLRRNTQWTADMLVAAFIPKWKRQDRIYYNGFPTPAPLAITFMENNHWGNATILWEEAYEKEKNLSKKARWASNTALSYEYADDVDTALKWINIAHDLLPKEDKSDLKKEIEEYKTILTERAKEAPLLKQQLRIIDDDTTPGL